MNRAMAATAPSSRLNSRAAALPAVRSCAWLKIPKSGASSGVQVVGLAQHLGSARPGPRRSACREIGLHGDEVVGLDLPDHRVLDRGDRRDDDVVLVLEAVRPPLLEHPDDPEADAVELHVPADRVVVLVPELLDDGLAHDRHLGVVGLVLLVDHPAVLGHGVADLGETAARRPTNCWRA